MKWYVLYTRPQAEQKAARDLEKLGFEVYCPLTVELRQWSDRKKLVKTPLFKSHIFLRATEATRREAFKAPSVLRFLLWLGKPAVVRDKEIETIKTWLEDDRYDQVQVQALQPGDRVLINNGFLKGKTGLVKEVGRTEVKMVLESLNMLVTTKLRDVR